jgi:hypothetical protein
MHNASNLLHYGLQRSGTNYIEALIVKNYHVLFLNSNEDRGSPLQKHSRLYKNKQIIPEPQYHNNIAFDTFDQFENLFDIPPDYYLIISKDPYSWFLSYKKWAIKCNWPNVTHHYIEEYNLFYKLFMDLSKQSNKFIFIRYIDLIQDEKQVLKSLEQRMNLRKRFLSRLFLFKPKRVEQSMVFTDNQRKYYLKEQYLNEFNTEDIRIINTLLNPDVLCFLGYEIRDLPFLH